PFLHASADDLATFPYTTLFRSIRTRGPNRGTPDQRPSASATSRCARPRSRRDEAVPGRRAWPPRRPLGRRGGRRPSGRSRPPPRGRKGTRLSSSHLKLSYAVLC